MPPQVRGAPSSVADWYVAHACVSAAKTARLLNTAIDRFVVGGGWWLPPPSERLAVCSFFGSLLVFVDSYVRSVSFDCCCL